jgi:hypothetical protein
MPSIIPPVLGALVTTGVITALWRLLRALRSRGRPPLGELAEVRVQGVVELLWTILLLVHFVLLEVLSESREVPSTLALLGNVTGALSLIAALASLVSCIQQERKLHRG